MVRRVIATFAVSFGLYLLLAGAASWTELAAGAGTAAAVTAFGVVRHLRQDRPVPLSAAALRTFAAALPGLLPDTARVGAVLARALLRPQAGASSWQPAAAADPACRAAAVLGTSLSPNGIVLEVSPAAMLVHRLAAAPA